MTESIDLLFARVGNIERVQSQMSAQIDLSAQIMDQVLRDQITLAKQLETTGQTVSRLAQRFPTTDSGPTRPLFQPSMNASGSGEPPFPTLPRVTMVLVVIRLHCLVILFLKWLFHDLLVKILESGRINALIIFTSLTYLSLCGLHLHP
jgi:hypothetical protein